MVSARLETRDGMAALRIERIEHAMVVDRHRHVGLVSRDRCRSWNGDRPFGVVLFVNQSPGVIVAVIRVRGGRRRAARPSIQAHDRFSRR